MTKRTARNGRVAEGNPPVASPRNEFRAMTRARILTEGRRCFEELGYTATKMEAIASRVGLGRTAIYQYFPSKADIMRQALEEDERLFSEAFAFAFTTDSEDAGTIGGRVRDLFDLYRKEGAFLRVIREAAASDTEVSDSLEANFQSLVDRIAAHASGTLHCDLARARVRIWMAISATDALFQRLLDPRWSLDEARALEEITRIWQQVGA